jgi:hypothetical protein
MPVFEYVLLALLGSAGAATPPGTTEGPLARTFTVDAVTQPSGGAEGEGLSGQRYDKGKGAGTGRKDRSLVDKASPLRTHKPFVERQRHGKIESHARHPMPPVPMAHRSSHKRR